MIVNVVEGQRKNHVDEAAFQQSSTVFLSERGLLDDGEQVVHDLRLLGLLSGQQHDGIGDAGRNGSGGRKRISNRRGISARRFFYGNFLDRRTYETKNKKICSVGACYCCGTCFILC